MNIKRPPIDTAKISLAIIELMRQCNERLEKHGPGIFAGKHEILGSITEEYYELIDAVRDDKHPEHFIDECMDIAVACIIGIASLKTYKVEDYENQ